MFIKYIDNNGKSISIDTDDMSYSQLIKLKEEVSGLPIYSVVCGIINKKVFDDTLKSKVICHHTGIKKFKRNLKIKRKRRK